MRENILVSRAGITLQYNALSEIVSIGFDAVAGLSGLSFTIKSVLAGRVHRITRAATRRAELHMLHDAHGGVFIALDEAPASAQWGASSPGSTRSSWRCNASTACWYFGACG